MLKTKPSTLIPMELRTFREEAPEPPIQLLGPWLRPKSLTMVYAPSGGGKSAFATMILESLADKDQCLGFNPTKDLIHTLYVDGEMPAWLTKQRLSKINAEELVHVISAQHRQNSINLMDEETQQVALVQWRTYDVVILDNKSSLWAVEDENDMTTWNPLIEFLSALKAEGPAVIFIHHSTKLTQGVGYSYRGSSVIAGAVDSIISMKPLNQKEREKVGCKDTDKALKIEMEKARLGGSLNQTSIIKSENGRVWLEEL